MAAHADEDLKANADLLLSQIGSYRASLQSGEDSTPLDKVQELWRQYIAGNEQMLAFAKTGQKAEAAERFRNSASRYYLLTAALEKISTSDAENSSAASAQAASIYEQSRFFVVIALGIIAALLF